MDHQCRNVVVHLASAKEIAEYDVKLAVIDNVVCHFLFADNTEVEPPASRCQRKVPEMAAEDTVGWTFRKVMAADLRTGAEDVPPVLVGKGDPD